MRLLIGLDDTDSKETRGTGFRARQLANLLKNELRTTVNGITRHQLFVHPDIAYTSQNSSACLDIETGNRKRLIDFCEVFVDEIAAPGSDAGLCIVEWDQINSDAMDWGKRAKAEVLKLNDALKLARNHHFYLQGFTGEKIGQIGALAAVGLRKDGDDGRFIWLEGSQELRDFDAGIYAVSELKEKADIDQIQTIDGTEVELSNRVYCNGWTRPVLKAQKSILFVEKSNLEQYDWKTVGKDYIRSIS